jgi:tetratricopeptide (TPR) repeat protein
MATDQRRATLEDDLDRARQTGDASAEAALLLQLGNLARDKESYDFALALHGQSWDAAQRAGDLQGQAAALCALLEDYVQDWMNSYNAQTRLIALTLCGDVQALYEQLGDTQGQARSWAARADVMTLAQDAAKTALYEQARAVYVQYGNLAGQAHILTRLGWIYARQRHNTEAIDCFERAVSLYEQVGDSERAVVILRKLANLHQNTPSNRPDEIFACQRLLAHYETLKQPLKIAMALSRLGHLANADQQYDMAVQYFGREVTLQEQYGERIQSYSLALYNHGGASMGIKDYETAKTAYRRALSLMDESQWVPYTECLIYLGVATARTDLGAGRAYAQRAFDIGESIDDTEDLSHRIQLRQTWAAVEVVHNHPDRAREILTAALTFAAKYPHGDRYTAPVRDQLDRLDSTDPEVAP